MESLTDQYIKEVQKNKEKLKKELLPLKENFGREALIYGREEVRFLNVPYIISQDDAAIFKQTSKTAYKILEKITRHYIKDKSYRDLFEFTPLVNDLILSAANYDCVIPIMRLDVFYNPQTREIKFCEINTDGTSALKEIMDINQAFAKSEVFKNVKGKSKLMYSNMYDILANSMLKVYSTYKFKTAEPLVAIADYTENAAMPELGMIKTAFENKGLHCIIANMREFTYKNNHLYYGEQKIDLVYRRASTCEIMEKIEDSAAFTKNALEGETAILGHFRTQVAHNKMLFALISKAATQEILSDEEKEFISKHFPFTTQLKNGNYDFNEVKYEKEKWVVKPKDAVGASRVFVGADMAQAEWERALNEGISDDCLIQEYCEPFKISNSYFTDDGELIEDEFGTMIGLYIFNGELKGFYPRAGKNGLISKGHGDFSMGAFIEEE